MVITLRQLSFLTTLSETLNFSEAAEKTFVTQPTLSAAIKELEDRLGVSLVERTRRSVIFTAIGLQVVERAKDVLHRAEEIENLARSFSNPEMGDFKLGAIPTVGPFLVPAALPRIRRRFPDLSLFLREEMTESLLEGVSSGRLDMALIALPFEIGGLEHTELFEDGYQLASPSLRSGEAARNGLNQTSIAPQNADQIFDNENLMLLEKGHCLQRHALTAFPDKDLSMDDHFAATSLRTLIAMVSEGMGVTLLPDLAILGGAADDAGVSLIPLPQAIPRKIVLVWRKTSAHKELFQKIGNILIETRQKITPK